MYAHLAVLEACRNLLFCLRLFNGDVLLRSINYTPTAELYIFFLCVPTLLSARQPHKDLFMNDGTRLSSQRHCTRSRPLVPEMCFSVGACKNEPPPSNYRIGEDGTSALLCCSSCQMQVHASKFALNTKVIENSACYVGSKTR